ncbi:hypothetical protein JDV02_000802 [Purpureocillium takamizusanense]|uniref:WSC domain-containing protein n=1 Tax=Purpureocillium takamizusanense TaxID=2060973 RepID=A0A9Q8Q838_9HYPO|nr:uncharacterized protein JDV02_000802 [Purpureocillium takamizusanense]UNI14137.1 hypothetical protein JDV02_000802 [Purpureocillium takamizusanense]
MRSFTAAAAALAVVPLTQAWNIQLPPCLEEFKPFVKSGCFQDSTGKALVYRGNGNNFTVESCVAECKGNGFRYAGLKYYGVCFCGATVNAPQVDESKCNLPCTANKNENCGGNDALSVWQDPTFPKGPDDTTVDSYKSLGCYTDKGPGRTLSWDSGADGATLTTKSCLAACEKQGYPYAGTEFGKECYCGSVLANNTAKTDDAQCNVPCAGDSSDKCGGRSVLNLYVATDLESLEPCGYKPPTTTTTTAVTTKPTETTTTKPGQDTTTTKPGQDTTTTTKPGQDTTTCTDSTTTTKPGQDTTTTTKPGQDTTTTTKPGQDTTTCTDSTTTTKPGQDTTTTTKPGQDTTTTTKPGQDTTTTKPGQDTTTKPTTTNGSPTTTTSSLCTATHTSPPPKCEWQIGNWCAPPLPDWHNKLECLVAAKTCELQGVSCFAKAGFPAVIDCFKFTKWCIAIKAHCLTDCLVHKGCSKPDCWDKNKPGPGHPPSTSTTVYPCPPSTTLKPTTTKPPVTTSCAPEPTNICTQPTNDKWGYGPGKPVGGIPLPAVCCNDIEDDFKRNPFKLYNDPDSKKCPSFPWPSRPNVCQDACEEQYEDCRDAYVKGCKTLGRKRSIGLSAREAETTSAQDVEFERRWLLSWGSGDQASCSSTGDLWSWGGKGSDSPSCWGKGGNTPDKALLRCKAQYQDCLVVNKKVDPGDKCRTWCKK